MAQKILLLDDDQDTLQALQLLLERSGYLVYPATTSASVKRWLDERARPDAAILDVNLKSESVTGLDLCREIKSSPETRQMPVIILSSFADNRTRVDAKAASADLVLNKPIEPGALIDALKAALSAPVQARRGALQCGGLSIDPVKHEVSFKGRIIKDLGPALFDLLYLLVAEYPDVIDRGGIVEGLNRPLTRDRETDVLVSRLRRRLSAEFGGEFVTTVTGKGYRFEPRS